MRAQTITPNLTQLTRLGLVNAFLVREDDGFTLVDTTIPRGARGFVEAARAAGGEIRRIALTHAHSDHVGSVDELRELLGPSVTVVIGEIDGRLLAGERVVAKSPPGGWPKLTTVPDQLQPGDRVGSLEVVASPGHSPGHIAFLDTRDRSLIAGDVFSSVAGLSVSSHIHWRFPLPALATWDRAIDLESARALRALDPAVLTVGHGGAIRGPASRMDQAIAEAEAAAR